MTVLDASAVAALLFDEPSGGRVADIVAAGEAVMSAVNYSEVAALLVRREVADFAAILGDLEHQVEIIPFDGRLAMHAALIAPLTGQQGLGLGDRACLALGRAVGRPVVTADHVWVDVADAVGVTVDLLRSSG